MPAYTLSESALRDFSRIVCYLHKKVSARTAAETESAIWAACADIARLNALGHRRDDLTSKDLLFYLVQRYFLIFERTEDGVLIHAVVHSAKDVAAVLKRRKTK
jgi:plasmid stabilization system protein ParE